ncbi:hypothetical protein [Rhizobium halophytocola]|uniref:Uncharacterized protein n=1 Tax=Rhizobium halophytocola TaxID=735519 RepID=A0ABS4DXW5_9HYPH|nr:hypothetical protein [Rhizobium halophytocola]MBP1850528.1 hypothetical protein [Rhizobium halophytocola]
MPRKNRFAFPRNRQKSNKQAYYHCNIRVINKLIKIDRKIRPFLHKFERSAIGHLTGYSAAIISFGAIIVGYWQFTDYFIHRQQQEEAQQEERYDRAWDRLLVRQGGDVRKGVALNNLLEAGISIKELDLGCQQTGEWDDKAKRCVRPAIFSNLKLSQFLVDKDWYDYTYKWPIFSSIPGGKDLVNLFYFRGNIILKSNLTSLVLDYTPPEISEVETEGKIKLAENKTFIEESEVRNTYIGNGYKNIEFSNNDASYFIAPVDFLKNVKKSNISAARLYYGSQRELSEIISSITQEDETKDDIFSRLESERGKNWAWADAPPMTSVRGQYQRKLPLPPSILERIVLADPRCRANAQELNSRSAVANSTPEDVRGITPNLIVPEGAPIPRDAPQNLNLIEYLEYNVDPECTITWHEAAIIYPDLYPQVPDASH